MKVLRFKSFVFTYHNTTEYNRKGCDCFRLHTHAHTHAQNTNTH